MGVETTIHGSITLYYTSTTLLTTLLVADPLYPHAKAFGNVYGSKVSTSEASARARGICVKCESCQEEGEGREEGKGESRAQAGPIQIESETGT